MKEKAFYFICAFSFISISVATILALAIPNPSEQVTEIIDKCMDAFYLSFIGILGFVTGASTKSPDDSS